ncbi:MAG: 3-deoxy-7-phosphoheptulonate synthase [Burkholderiales bacterium]
MKSRIDNLNILSQQLLPTPAEIKKRLPLTRRARQTVAAGRRAVQRILERKDHRLLVVVGPCSIHDMAAAHDYASRLKKLADEISDTFLVVMRMYFEKPRTTVGWKGFINDPDMDDSFHIEKGLRLARGLLRDLAEMGLPAGTEALDPIVPQYLADLITWTAIGARTTESQTHREMASGLSSPVGFKNGTDGGFKVAINALLSVSHPHNFLGIDKSGRCVVIRTRGNPHAHMVLRGGAQPNYDAASISQCEKELAANKLAVNIMVDCSHANSSKNYNLQPAVLQNCARQIQKGNSSLIGFMLEGNIEAGNQPIPADLAQLKYGVSVTDACMDWSATQNLLRTAREDLKTVLTHRRR